MVFPIAALIAAAGTGVGALINKSATDKATAASTAATTQNNALARELYGKNTQNLQPYMNAGAAATGAISQQLGLGGGYGGSPYGGNAGQMGMAAPNQMSMGGGGGLPAGVDAAAWDALRSSGALQGDDFGYGSPSGSAGRGEQDWSAYLQANPDVMQWAQETVAAGAAPDLASAAQQHYQNHGQAEGRQVPMLAAQSQPSTPDMDGSSYGPQMGARQTYTRPDAGAAPTFNRPGDTGRPADPTRASYVRPEMPGFKFGKDEYVKTPGFDFQQERGMGALKSDKTFNGLLRSGAALKGALDFSQNLAMQDFTGERAFAYGQYSDDRNRQDNIFSQDRAYGTGVFDTDRNRQDNIFAGDRARQDGIFESDRGYGTDLYMANRDFANNNFTSDRNFGTGIYDADRSYATSRFDTRTNDLFNLSSQGLSGANALSGVSTNYLNNVSSNNNTQAGITANAALAGAGNTNALIGDAMYAFGRRGSSYGAPSASGSGGGAYDYMSPAQNRFLSRY